MHKQIKAMIFDLDGTVYNGDEPIPGVADFMGILNNLGIAVRFYTNRAVLTAEEIAEKLNRMKMDVSPEQVFTSALVTARKLHGRRVFVIGEEALRTALSNESAVITDKNTEYVVVGSVKNLMGKDLKKAVQLIYHHGAVFTATNQDPYIIENGLRVPVNGAILAAIEVVSERAPIVYGKPNPAGINMILETLKASPEEVFMVGDNEATDIECGIRAGVRTALILTGVSSPQKVSESRAEWVIEDYSEFTHRLLKEMKLEKA